MKFTAHQAKENGKAVAAFLLGKAIEARRENFHPWTPCRNVAFADQYYLRVKPELAPPARWSRMEHVPLNAWLRRKGQFAIRAINSIWETHIFFASNGASVRWAELAEYEYTTGERDASGSFIFRECLALP